MLIKGASVAAGCRRKARTMVGVAQLVEPRVVIPVVVGSSPIVHPNPPKQKDRSDTGDCGLIFRK